MDWLYRLSVLLGPTKELESESGVALREMPLRKSYARGGGWYFASWSDRGMC